jgi:hypothetical protein
MRRHMLALAALLLAACAAAWLPFAARSGPAGGRVYTVADILHAAGRNPAAWDGRVAQVRGAIGPGQVLVLEGPGLPDHSLAAHVFEYVPLADGPAAPAVLWVTSRRDGGLAALLRRLPLLAALAPAPRAPRVAEVRTYRVELHALPARCRSSVCVLGTLVDFAAPALDPFGFAGAPSGPAGKH